MTASASERTAEAFNRLAASALRGGGSLVRDDHEHLRVRWSLAGDGATACREPVERHLVGLRPGLRPSSDYHVRRGRHPVRDIIGTATLVCRCRKCEPCLKTKARYWYLRAVAEVPAASRVWFLTGTFSPWIIHDWRRRAPIAASADWSAWSHGERSRRLSEQPTAEETAHFELMSEKRRERALLRIVNHQITLYLARVRKASGKGFRYLLVIERHASGEPHMHALVYEQAGQCISERTWRGEWRPRLGLVFQAKLIEQDRNAPRYVCKYISKAPECRMRASRHFGRLSTPSVG